MYHVDPVMILLLICPNAMVFPFDGLVCDGSLVVGVHTDTRIIHSTMYY